MYWRHSFATTKEIMNWYLVMQIRRLSAARQDSPLELMIENVSTTAGKRSKTPPGHLHGQPIKLTNFCAHLFF